MDKRLPSHQWHAAVIRTDIFGRVCPHDVCDVFYKCPQCNKVELGNFLKKENDHAKMIYRHCFECWSKPSKHEADKVRSYYKNVADQNNKYLEKGGEM